MAVVIAMAHIHYQLYKVAKAQLRRSQLRRN